MFLVWVMGLAAGWWVAGSDAPIYSHVFWSVSFGIVFCILWLLIVVLTAEVRKK